MGDKTTQGITLVYKKFGYIEIDDARINETCDAYFKWKDLNTYIKSTSSRGINMPDAISEPMGCYCLGYLWNRDNEVGDATDPETNAKTNSKPLQNLTEIYLHSVQKPFLIILYS